MRELKGDSSTMRGIILAGKWSTLGSARKVLTRVLASLRRSIAAATADHYFHALAAYTVLLSTIQILTIGCSLAKMTISTGLAIVILLLSLAAASLWWHKQKPSHVRQAEDCTQPLSTSLPILLTLFAAITFLLLCVVAYLRPDRSFDANVFHIPPIHLWARKGYIHWINPAYQCSKYMNGYPKGVESVGFILCKVLGSHVVNTTNLVYLPLGVLGIAYLSRALKASAEVALFAGSAFILIPVNICQSSTLYVDTAYASSAIALVAVALHALHTLAPARSFPWSDLPILGGTMGLALGAKATGVLLAAITIATLALVAFFALLRTASGNKRGFARKSSLFLFFAVMIGVVVGGYWYVRNFALTGSPIYPAGLALGNHGIFPGPPVSEVINAVGNTHPSMRSWPEITKVLFTWSQGLWNWPRPILLYGSRFGGLGYLWLLGCVPSTLFLFYRFVRRQHSWAQRRFLLVLLTIVSIAFLGTPLRWWARYTVNIYALGLPCFAYVLDRILRGYKSRPAWFWSRMCLVVLVLEASICLSDAIYPSNILALYHNPLGLLESKNWRYKPILPELEGTVFDEMLSGGDSIAIGPVSGHWQSIMGRLSIPIGSRNWIALSGELSESDVDQIISQQVRYVVWDKMRPIPLALRRLAVKTDIIEPVMASVTFDVHLQLITLRTCK